LTSLATYQCKRSTDPTSDVMAALKPTGATLSCCFPFHGSRVSSWLRLVCPDTMRFRTSVSHASGSTVLSLAVWISVATIARCFPPLSGPRPRDVAATGGKFDRAQYARTADCQPLGRRRARDRRAGRQVSLDPVSSPVHDHLLSEVSAGHLFTRYSIRGCRGRH
jgi:hypothetical protein